MGTALDIKIKRANKVYRCGEVLSGVVVITSKDTVQHQGISLTMEGSVNLQLSAKSVGVFEAFYNSVKPIQIINSTIEMVKPGKLPSGKTEIPFEFPLHMKGNKVLYETYHGVFVNIQYTLRCDMRRSLLAKDLTKTCEFIVHSLSQKGKLTPSPVDFTITPETLQNVKEIFIHTDKIPLSLLFCRDEQSELSAFLVCHVLLTIFMAKSSNGFTCSNLLRILCPSSKPSLKMSTNTGSRIGPSQRCTPLVTSLPLDSVLLITNLGVQQFRSLPTFAGLSACGNRLCLSVEEVTLGNQPAVMAETLLSLAE
ncbi:vacuolar protein sorting-associated protein 26C isoform X1 [Falco biarmicus]|uniref:vacuolar protein sorting-associated protein 26C isoform X2 n=1 Tax=Falco rusticolus TaxID=120794 RepID=UPI0018868AC5|nr:vacuolar protein sorting-associated protein 26C isoform X2 [Falco rusticolus]XP_055559217.1 vacuolar protein sorting-associated protein 26C isoform X1 [Falco cherrug]XP_055659134.1 vacuolar protein sorting-associated protein 26C isoform X1 [Falco peregrinus]XP_056185741.1 vacuolar protein sorting-associated protein 26C isoform X1 [Falco biarmicus]